MKWTDERSGSFVSDSHGRDHEMTAELALDADGHFLAVRLTGYGNMGGFLATVAPIPLDAQRRQERAERLPHAADRGLDQVRVHQHHAGLRLSRRRPARGQLLHGAADRHGAAAEMGIDRLELRRRNHIRPREMPYKTASGMTYDSGDFATVMKKAVEAADAKGFAARKRESRKRGKLRGLGIGSFLEVTAPPNKEMGGIRFFEADGSVTILTGTLDFGMGHATPFAQVLSEKLGIPFEKIRLVQGDSDELIAGGGTGGSRSIMRAAPRSSKPPPR